MRPRSLYKNSFAFVAVAPLILFGAAVAFGQASSFTYQGRLTDGGTAANGNYDLQFALFDSASGGTQIASTQTLNTVAVSNGVFSVTLDFGASSFPGANRFLEISARPSGAGSFTLLTPRQQVTSTPYAVRSANASLADTATTATTATNATQLGGIAASQYVQTSDSRLTDARPPTTGSANYIQNSSNQQSSTNFNISGNGVVGGTLTGNVVNAADHFNLNNQPVMSVTGCGGSPNGNTFTGIGAGASNTPCNSGGNDGIINSFFGGLAGNKNTTGRGNSFFGAGAGTRNTTGIFNSYFGQGAGSFNTDGVENSIFGSSAGVSNTGSANTFMGEGTGNLNTSGSNNSFFGQNAGIGNSIGSFNTLLGYRTNVSPNDLTNATAVGACAVVTRNNSLILGSISSGNLVCSPQPDTNVGIGTTAPLSRLDVRGDLFVGVSASPSNPNAVNSSNSLFIGNDSGDANVSLRLDGFQNNLFIVARSGSGAAAGAGIVFRTATAGGGEADVVTINPSGTLSVPRFGSAGTATVCRNSASELAFCSSSLRYKTNVATFIGGLDIINRLRPISFKWKQDGVEDIGLGAEEVEKVAPLFTFKNDKGEIEGVRYDRLGVLFVNAFKELQTEIEQQQEQLKRQQEQIKRQEQQAKQERVAFAAQQRDLDDLKKLLCRSHRRAGVCK